MTKKIKSIPIGQKCKLCGSKIYATLYNIDGEHLICETCDCVDKYEFPKMLSIYTARDYALEIKNRTLVINGLYKDITRLHFDN